MGQESTRAELLRAVLQLAVRVEIANLARQPEEHRPWLARKASQVIAEHGDNVLYRGPRDGDTARAFAALARGLAAAAYQPGGITFLELHWRTGHDRCTEAAKAAIVVTIPLRPIGRSLARATA